MQRTDAGFTTLAHGGYLHRRPQKLLGEYLFGWQVEFGCGHFAGADQMRRSADVKVRFSLLLSQRFA